MYFEKFEKIKWSPNFDFSTQKLIYWHFNFFEPKKTKNDHKYSFLKMFLGTPKTLYGDLREIPLVNIYPLLGDKYLLREFPPNHHKGF